MRLGHGKGTALSSGWRGLGTPWLTRMRSPVVKRQPLPWSGFFAFFPLFQGRRRQQPVSCPDFMSVWVQLPCGCTKHVLRLCHHGNGECRGTSADPLRPRNLSVPSYPPTQREGSAVIARQLVPGSGEGQHTSTKRDSRRRQRSRSGCSINRRGLRGHGLCAHGRSLTQRDTSCQALSPGSPRVRPVRRWAHPLRSLRMEKLVQIERRVTC